MYKFVNLTPHRITLISNDCSKILVDLEGNPSPARVKHDVEVLADIGGLEVRRMVPNSITNLPEPEFGTLFIISSKTLEAVRELEPTRRDFVVIDPTKFIKDEEGNVLGTRGLLTL